MSEEEIKTTPENNTRKSKKQKRKPRFMSMTWLRLHIKEVVWFIIITFVISLFFIGYGTSYVSSKQEEKIRAYEKEEQDSMTAQNAVPQSLQGKENETALTITYDNGKASATVSIDAKSLWKEIKNNPQYAKLSKSNEKDNPFKNYMIDNMRSGIVNQVISTNILGLYAKVNNIVPPLPVDEIIRRDIANTTEAEFNRELHQQGLTLAEYGQKRLLQITVAMAAQSAVAPIPVASATEDYLKNYYDTHKVNFKQTDKISFDHLLVTAADLASSKEISDDQVKAYFAKNPSEELKEVDYQKIYESRRYDFTTPEQVKASHILIKPNGEGSEEQRLENAHKKALDLYEKAKNGEDFAKLASENSEDEGSAANGGDLGFFSHSDMVKPFADAAFATNIGSITEPVKSFYGYHIIKVVAKNPEKIQSFEEAKSQLEKENIDKVKSIIALQIAEEEIAEVAKKLIKDNGSANIEALTKAYGHENGRKHSYTDLPISDNPGSAYQELYEGLGEITTDGYFYNLEVHKHLIEAAKANKLNVYLEPFKSSMGYHIVKVLSYKGDQYDTFEESRNSIRHIVTLEPSDAEINQYFEENKSRFDTPATRTVRQILCADKDSADKVYQELKEGAVFARLARSYSADPSAQNGGLMPATPKGHYSKELDDAIWNLNKEECTEPIQTPFGWVIAKLEDTKDSVSATLEGSTLYSIKNELRKSYNDEAFTSFIKGLNNQAYVVRNQELIDLIK